MKYSGYVWSGLLVIACATAGYLDKNYPQLIGRSDQSVTHAAITTNSLKFLELCTGVHMQVKDGDMKESAVNVLAISNCLGRTRGFVDGHQMTVEMNRQAGKSVRALWCVPQSVDDRQLLETVLTWTDNEQAQFKELEMSYTGMTAAFAVIIRAVSQKYPCS